MKRSGLFCLLLLCLLWRPSPLSAVKALVWNNGNNVLPNMSALSCVYVLERNNLIPLSEHIKNLEVNQSHLCVLLIRNESNNSIHKVLQFGHRYFTVKGMRLWYPKNKVLYLKDERISSLPVDLASGEQVLLSFFVPELNRADPQMFQVNLLSLERWEEEQNTVYRQQSFFLGLFAFLTLFNVIIYFVTRWKVYLKYALYIFTSLFYFSYYFGLLQQISPLFNELPVNIAYTWYSGIFITYFVFLNEFGAYREYVPMAHRLLNIGIVFKLSEGVLNTLLHLFGFSFIYSAVYVNTILGLEIILMAFILFYILKNKNIRGRLVVLASFFLIAMGIVEQSKMFPDKDSAFFVEVGIVCELMTFSVGLGYVSKMREDEKRKAELRYVEQLLANGKLQREHTEQLEALVALRTDELRKEKREVEKKNTENELLLAEVHHRVKNNLQVMSSLLSLQEKSVSNKDAKKAIRDSKERIRSMELVHKLLYKGNSYRGIEMKDYVNRLYEGLRDSFGRTNEDASLELNFSKLILDLDTAIPLGLILNELLVNAFKHARGANDELQINISLIEEKGDIILKLSDNGEGTVKKLEETDSFGLRIIRALVRQLDGELQVKDEAGLDYLIKVKNHKFQMT